MVAGELVAALGCQRLRGPEKKERHNFLQKPRSGNCSGNLHRQDRAGGPCPEFALTCCSHGRHDVAFALPWRFRGLPGSSGFSGLRRALP